MKLANYSRVQFNPGDIVVGIEGVPLYISKSIDIWHVKDGNSLLVLKSVWSNLENVDMIYVVEMETKVEGWVKSFYLKKAF